MAQPEWIKALAKRVIEILESNGTISRGIYESLAFRNALEQAAREQKMNIITDHAKWVYAFDGVKNSVQATLRYRNRIQAEAHHPVTAGVTAPKKGWMEHALPPGDRD